MLRVCATPRGEAGTAKRWWGLPAPTTAQGMVVVSTRPVVATTCTMDLDAKHHQPMLLILIQHSAGNGLPIYLQITAVVLEGLVSMARVYAMQAGPASIARYLS